MGLSSRRWLILLASHRMALTRERKSSSRIARQIEIFSMGGPPRLPDLVGVPRAAVEVRYLFDYGVDHEDLVWQVRDRAQASGLDVWDQRGSGYQRLGRILNVPGIDGLQELPVQGFWERVTCLVCRREKREKATIDLNRLQLHRRGGGASSEPRLKTQSCASTGWAPRPFGICPI